MMCIKCCQEMSTSADHDKCWSLPPATCFHGVAFFRFQGISYLSKVRARDLLKLGGKTFEPSKLENLMQLAILN